MKTWFRVATLGTISLLIPIAFYAFKLYESIPYRHHQKNSHSESTPTRNWRWILANPPPRSNSTWLSTYLDCPLLDAQDACSLSRHISILSWTPPLFSITDSPLEILTSPCFINKHIAISGDSLSRQSYHAFVCWLTAHGFNLILSSDKNTAKLAFPDSLANITIHWTGDTLNPYLVAYEGGRPNPVLKPLIHESLRELLNTTRVDYLVLNTGLWLDPSSYTESNIGTYLEAYAFVVKESLKGVEAGINEWTRNAINGSAQNSVKITYRNTPFRHFKGGDFNTGGTCNKSNGEGGVGLGSIQLEPELNQNETQVILDTYYGADAEMKQNKLLEMLIQNERRKLLNNTNGRHNVLLTRVLDAAHIARWREDAHRSVSDCSHYCLPGVPDVWNLAWLEMISKEYCT